MSTADPAPVFFSTERLRFRAFEGSDLDALASINASARVSRFVDDGQPLSRADTARWISNSRANLARFGYGTGAVVLRRTNTLIGWAGFARGSDPEDIADEEIIYGFDEPYWGQGFGLELVTALVDYGFETLSMPRLRATVYRANTASARILTRLGFRCVEQDYDGEAGIDLYVCTRPRLGRSQDSNGATIP